MACRRIVALQPAAGALWWLAARVLASPDPGAEVWRAVDALGTDRTGRELANAIPEDAIVVTVGPAIGEPMQEAAQRRGDLSVLHIEMGSGVGDAGFSSRRRDASRARSSSGRGHPVLGRGGVHGDAEWAETRGESSGCTVLPPAALGSAVALADVVVVDVLAAGPDAVLVPVGALAAAAVAAHESVDVWAVAPLGTVLPKEMWAVLRDRISGTEPWERGSEVLGADLLTGVVRPSGLRPVEASLAMPDCGAVPELLVSGDVA